MSERMETHHKVLGIIGSPRRNGNTEILVDEVLAAAEESGALVEKVFLSELKIAPCQACDVCQKTGKCHLQDDMVKLEEQMQNSPVWVFGTPVYWWGPTAQFKAFIDRWYGIKRAVFQGKRVILVIPFGGGHKNYARHVLGMFKDIINYLNMKLVTAVLAPSSESRSAVQNNTIALTKARRAGREAIQLIDWEKI